MVSGSSPDITEAMVPYKNVNRVRHIKKLFLMTAKNIDYINQESRLALGYTMKFQ